MNIFEKSGISFTMVNNKLRVEGLKNLPGNTANEIRRQIRENKKDIIQGIYQQEHDALWQKADKLADWIDNPNSEIPWQERTTKITDLQEMSAEIDRLIGELEKQIETGIETLPDGGKKYKGLDGVWYPYKAKLQPEDEAVKPEKCPASCKQTGRCYSTTWFTGKPGPFPGPVCSDTTDCIWIETGKHEEMKR